MRAGWGRSQAGSSFTSPRGSGTLRERVRGGALKEQGVPHYDFVSVHHTSELRLLRAGKYPVLRGTHFTLGEIHFLYTTGFIPARNAYPHGHVPSPLQVADHIGDSDVREVLERSYADEDELELSQFRYFKAYYPPVLKLVGDILKEIPQLIGSPFPSSSSTRRV